MFYLYVLESGDHRYIGSTSNLRRRLKEHNTGRNESTKLHRPWTVIYYEAHTIQEDAERRESYFKTSQGRLSLKRMLRAHYESKGKSSGDQRSTSGQARSKAPKAKR